MGSAIQLPINGNPLLAIEIAKAHFKAKGKKLKVSKAQYEYLKAADAWPKIRDYAVADKDDKA